jgi:hypothetical protein
MKSAIWFADEHQLNAENPQQPKRLSEAKSDVPFWMPKNVFVFFSLSLHSQSRGLLRLLLLQKTTALISSFRFHPPFVNEFMYDTGLLTSRFQTIHIDVLILFLSSGSSFVLEMKTAKNRQGV